MVSISRTAGTDDEASDYKVDAVIFVTKKSCATIVFIKAAIKQLGRRIQE